MQKGFRQWIRALEGIVWWKKPRVENLVTLSLKWLFWVHFVTKVSVHFCSTSLLQGKTLFFPLMSRTRRWLPGCRVALLDKGICSTSILQGKTSFFHLWVGLGASILTVTWVQSCTLGQRYQCTSVPPLFCTPKYQWLKGQSQQKTKNNAFKHYISANKYGYPMQRPQYRLFYIFSSAGVVSQKRRKKMPLFAS
jgi:hypothetical protein